MCLTHSQNTSIPDTVPTFPQPDSTSDQPITNQANPLASVLRNNGVDPSNFSVRKPSVMGRVAEVATGGAYDPTGGADTGKFGPNATKFGALMKILTPALQGATIGGFLGKSTPGGGFAATNNFYLQQRMRQMMMSEFMQKMALNQSTIAKNTAEAQWAQRRPLITRTGPVISGKDAMGNPVTMAQNPNKTGTPYEPISGFTPNQPVKELMTDTGAVTFDPNNPQKGAVPLTLAQQASSAQREGNADSASEPSDRAQGKPDASGLIPPTLPRVPGNAGSPAASPAATAIPLHPPNFNQPKAAIRASRNAAGVETDNIIDENPNSPTFGKTIKKTGVTRAPLPDKAANKEAKTEGVNADIETYASEALKRNGNDPDKAIQFMNGLKTGDPESDKKLQAMLPKIRQHIRDRVKQGKKRLSLSPEDAKAAGLTPTQNSSVANEEENP